MKTTVLCQPTMKVSQVILKESLGKKFRQEIVLKMIMGLVKTKQQITSSLTLSNKREKMSNSKK